MKIFVYIETKEGKPINGSLELLSAAKMGEATAILAGTQLAEASEQVAKYGVPVMLAELPTGCGDEITAALEKLIAENKPDAVLFSASQNGKDIAPRLAQRLGTGCVTDAIALDAAENGAVVFTRPAFGGTILEHMTIESTRPQIATVRPGSYAKPAAGTPAAVTPVSVTLPDDAVRVKLVKVAKEITETVNLEGADVVITGGRGMGTAENFKLVEELAALLGGVVGATRPAMEEGWISRAHQVGQSGKTVAPRLYIACGVSGSMQHISGMLGSKYIVAVNKDESAPIFDIADVGIVGDVKDILPVMIEEIRKRKEA